MSDATFLLHSHPFRMIDVVLELERERCTTIKSVTSNEEIRDEAEAAAGRYPLSLLVEAMAQAAVPLAVRADDRRPHATSGATPGRGMIAGIDGVRLLRPVRPGDRLLISATVLGRLGDAPRPQRRRAGGRSPGGGGGG